MVRYALLLAFSFPNFAFAGVVSRDLFEPGDGLVTYDSVNEREWLDFYPRDFDSVDELIAEMQPGGRYNDFRFATVDDLRDLATSAGVHFVDEGQSRSVVTDGAVQELMGLIEWTVEARNELFGTVFFSGGLVATTTGQQIEETAFDGTSVFLYLDPPPDPWVLNRPIPPTYGSLFVTDEPLQFGDDPPIVDYWLYREAATVPEPAAMWLALAACVAASRLRGLA